PGRDLIFALLVGSLMVPNAVVLVPQYILTQQLGWLSTYQGLIVPEGAMRFAFGVFLLRQFFLTFPASSRTPRASTGPAPGTSSRASSFRCRSRSWPPSPSSRFDRR